MFVCSCVQQLVGPRGHWAEDSAHDFVIENTSDADAGDYWCRVQNSAGVVDRMIHVAVRDCTQPQVELVREAPAPPLSPYGHRTGPTQVTAVAVAAILTAFIGIALVLVCAFARRTFAPLLLRRRRRSRRTSRLLTVRDLLWLVYPLKRQTHPHVSPPAAGDESVALVDLLLDVLCCLPPPEKKNAEGAPSVANLTQVELRPLSKRRVVIMKQVLKHYQSFVQYYVYSIILRFIRKRGRF